MGPAQLGNASNDDSKRAFSMKNYFLEDSYIRKQTANVEESRQPRSPLREPNGLHPATSNRDKSTSSSEKRDSSAKRNSLFSKRPKSAVTTTSNEGSPRSLTPNPPTSGETSRPSSTTDVPAVPAETDTSRSRFLFGRSRKHRKSSGSKLRASSPIEADDESDQYRYRKEEKHRRSSSSDRRMRISNPFGFQHVAKIEKQREKDDSSELSDIFADFRALRKRHRTAIIGPSREVEPDLHTMEDNGPKRQPPLRPKRSDEMLKEEELLASTHGMLPLRQIRSAETFTVSPPSSANTTTPRHYAHRPPPLNQTANIFTPDYPPRNTASDEWDRLLPYYDSRIPGNPNEIGFHPLTQTESVPEPIRSPMFNPPLEQVPEEPEGTLSNRQSVDYSRQQSMRHSKSSPTLSRNGSKFSRSSHKEPPLPPNVEIVVTERPLSQGSEGSDTLGDPDRLSVPVKELEKAALTRTDSVARDTGSSWEDDVDYCYRHAAEADCDFDWRNTSRLDDADSDDLYRNDGPFSDPEKLQKREQSCSMASTASSEGDQYRLTSRVYQVPSKEGVPELDYRSSHSASTNSISVLTPLDKFSFSSFDSVRQPKRDSSRDPLSPQLSPPSDRSPSQQYDDVLAKAGSTPPYIPIRSDSRDKALSNEIIKRFDLLPTPPPSASQSPTIPRPSENRSATKDLSVDTIVAQLRSRTLESPVSPEQPNFPDDPPSVPPKSPRTLARRSTNENAPVRRPRNYSGTLNAAKLKLNDAQDRLHGLGPTSMPRTHSDDSVVTAIPTSKLPTPPKSPYSGEAAPGGLTFLGTPSPISPVESNYFTPRTSPSPAPSQQHRYMRPQHVFQQQSEFYQQQEPQQPRDSSHSQHDDANQRSQAHRKVSSDSAARMETAPASPPPRNTSANGVHPARSSYSLFPVPPKTPPPTALSMLSPLRGTYPVGATPLPLGYPPSLRSPVNPGFPTNLKSPKLKERRLATY
jgi:hypothetical protein